jgi:hypothetical protein
VPEISRFFGITIKMFLETMRRLTFTRNMAMKPL